MSYRSSLQENKILFLKTSSSIRIHKNQTNVSVDALVSSLTPTSTSITTLFETTTILNVIETSTESISHLNTGLLTTNIIVVAIGILVSLFYFAIKKFGKIYENFILIN